MTVPKGRMLGYVLANVSAERPAKLSRADVMEDRDEALDEAREWSKRGDRYRLASVWLEEE